jgi:DNA-binding XRE family transcriptional regulator
MPKINKERKRNITEFKESVLKRLKPPTKETVASLAGKLGVSRTAIYTWRRGKVKSLGSPKSTKEGAQR